MYILQKKRSHRHIRIQVPQNQKEAVEKAATAFGASIIAPGQPCLVQSAAALQAGAANANANATTIPAAKRPSAPNTDEDVPGPSTRSKKRARSGKGTEPSDEEDAPEEEVPLERKRCATFSFFDSLHLSVFSLEC